MSSSRLAGRVPILAAGGDLNPELAALPWLRFHTDAATHPLDAFSNERQANASAGILFDRMEALEETEDFLVMLGGDADPVVANGNAEVAFRIRFGPNTNMRNA